MATNVFVGKDEADLNQQLWAFRSKYPQIVIREIHPIERISVTMQDVSKYELLEAQDTVQMHIHYDQPLAVSAAS